MYRSSLALTIGANLGHDVTYSGTVHAAMETVITGILVWLSRLKSQKLTSSPLDFSASAYAAHIAAENVLYRMELPQDTLLSINIPAFG
ncbi:MAG: hypothetical protein IPG44_10090 [Anaerolineales bacterium]|nr:hypothetical protein [Anaerolineales bacterium]